MLFLLVFASLLRTRDKKIIVYTDYFSYICHMWNVDTVYAIPFGTIQLTVLKRALTSEHVRLLHVRRARASRNR